MLADVCIVVIKKRQIIVDNKWYDLLGKIISHSDNDACSK